MKNCIALYKLWFDLNDLGHLSDDKLEENVLKWTNENKLNMEMILRKLLAIVQYINMEANKHI